MGHSFTYKFTDKDLYTGRKVVGSIHLRLEKYVQTITLLLLVATFPSLVVFLSP
jgi:hypothetical protein